jgi:hypothetical protein
MKKMCWFRKKMDIIKCNILRKIKELYVTQCSNEKRKTRSYIVHNKGKFYTINSCKLRDTLSAVMLYNCASSARVVS